MDRNSIIGIILIAGILVVYSIFSQPSKEQIEEAKHKRDSLELVHQKEILMEKAIEEAKAQMNKSEIISDTLGKDELKSLYGNFAEAAEGTQQFITLENNLMKIKLTNKGGRIYSVELKEFKSYTQEPLILFDGDSTVFGLNFFSQNRSIITNDLYFKALEETLSYSVENDLKTVKLRLYAGEGRYIEYAYTMYPNSYKLDFDINFVGINEVIASNLNVIDLKWSMYSPQLEKGAKNENQYTTIGYKFYNDEVNSLTSRGKDTQSEELNEKIKWISYQQQFFSSILVAKNFFPNAEIEFQNLKEDEEPGKYLKHFRSTIGIPFENLEKSTIPLEFYFGPNHFNTLKEYKNDFERIVPLGWGIFGWVNRFIVIPVFNFLDNYILNYGLIILLLTIFIKLILFPLTYKSYLSTAKMKVLKPEVDEIAKKFPKQEDAMKKQQATMAMYKKAGVNPMGGCIPMLIQFPIIIALFRFFPASFELRQKSFLWADDLSSYDSVLNLPFNIPLGYGDHVSLFTILMAVALIFTTKISTAQMGDTTQQIPGMKFMMTWLMPIMMLFFFNNYSSGLTYYYFLSNVFTLGQTYLMRGFVNDEEIMRKIHENKKKPVVKSKWQQRLEEAAKKRGYNPNK
ncbi:MAG: membrane protein insertase YidC [Bacteroidales bacterium]|jgi:YidC/Oxa1 family membrane protein insertase|nr:membrane protein insertase YidC [Bacteroidales bacterium]